MSIKNLIKNSALAGIVAGALASCQSHTVVYHSFHTLPHDGWNKSDTLTFSIPTENLPTGNCALQIEIRHTEKFAYRSLWMVVYQNAEDSTHFVADTLQCVLADEKGRFLGPGLNHYYQMSFPLKTVTLPHTYTPVFKLAHYMKKGRIEGIEDVGICLTEE